jgi:hypothetical protein
MDDAILDSKLDKLIEVTTRTEAHVATLLKSNVEHRLTQLETRNKVLQWVGGTAMAIVSIILSYFGLR